MLAKLFKSSGADEEGVNEEQDDRPHEPDDGPDVEHVGGNGRLRRR